MMGLNSKVELFFINMAIFFYLLSQTQALKCHVIGAVVFNILGIWRLFNVFNLGSLSQGFF